MSEAFSGELTDADEWFSAATSSVAPPLSDWMRLINASSWSSTEPAASVVVSPAGLRTGGLGDCDMSEQGSRKRGTGFSGRYFLGIGRSADRPSLEHDTRQNRFGSRSKPRKCRQTLRKTAIRNRPETIRRKNFRKIHRWPLRAPKTAPIFPPPRSSDVAKTTSRSGRGEAVRRFKRFSEKNGKGLLTSLRAFAILRDPVVKSGNALIFRIDI